jgi:primary-amine oxidase
MAVPVQPAEKVTHPLDPLTAAELAAVVALLRADPSVPEPVRFVTIALDEPSKANVAAFQPGAPIERRANAVLVDPVGQTTLEATLDLTAATVTEVAVIPGVQAAITVEEYLECEQVVRADPGFRAALQARGITDFDLVTVEAWGLGGFGDPSDGDRRLAWTPTWLRHHPEDNPYAHPIEGLYAIVDLNTMQVVRIEDHGATTMPQASGDYRPEAIGAPRTDLRPLEITQPEGPSFTVDGWQVSWQRWRLRVGFTPREGLVLHTLGFEDGGRIRPVLHRASFAELVIPYGDGTPGGYRKNAFDLGEYGAGPLTNALELGCDCVGDIRYFDVPLCTSAGEVHTLANAICMHEEDTGILWKHTDPSTLRVDMRRSRRLVISSVITVGNYEYAFYWHLYQDGTIEVEAKLTGILLTSAIEPGEQPQYGRLVSPGVVASHHQHFFNVRLDMCVDGPQNTVVEVHTETAPDEINPHRNAFVARSRPLVSESEAQRLVDPFSARSWKITNPNSTNAVGEPVAYRLVPGENTVPFAHDDSSLIRRAGFIKRHLWVTPYRADERYPAGEYPNQSSDNDGLTRWTANDRSIENEDLVVWYTFCSHHVARLEDWPIMPVAKIGFMLKPDGFFDRNPTLDAPLPPRGCNHRAH